MSEKTPYRRTDFFWNKGAVVTSGSGPYKQEYIRIAIQRKNFPFSSLRNSIWSNSAKRTWGDTTYIETVPSGKRDAQKSAKRIRELGGLARVTYLRKDFNNRPLWMVWFNPNGSMPAYDLVSGW